MDWGSFQQDFLKVFSSIGLGQHPQNENVNPAQNATKDDEANDDQSQMQSPEEREANELRKRAAAEAALVRERNEDWVKGGVWDSRVNHPVPAFPVRVRENILIETESNILPRLGNSTMRSLHC